MGRSGAVSALVGLVIMVSTLRRGAMAATHIVGGDIGWTLPATANSFINYTAWADQQTFIVGDVLHFQYSAGAHTVQPLPSKESFAGCNISAAVIPAFEGGSTDISLKTLGTKWYICGIGQHCQEGMKFKINVFSAVGAPAPAPTTAETGSATGIAVSHGSALAVAVTALLVGLLC